jgi:hypothetical protein
MDLLAIEDIRLLNSLERYPSPKKKFKKFKKFTYAGYLLEVSGLNYDQG